MNWQLYIFQSKIKKIFEGKYNSIKTKYPAQTGVWCIYRFTDTFQAKIYNYTLN